MFEFSGSIKDLKNMVDQRNDITITDVVVIVLFALLIALGTFVGVS